MNMATKHSQETIKKAQQARKKQAGMLRLPFKARLAAYDAVANAPSNTGKVWGKLAIQQDKAKAEQSNWPIEYCL